MAQNFVPQTYKTIIFEEFDPSKTSLVEIVNDSKKTSDGNKLIQSLEELTVHSFDEFMEKFAPTVYEVCTEVDGKIRFFYTINYDEVKTQPHVEKKISEDAYYKMLSRMYDAKGASGQNNLTFDDSEILEILTPKQEVEAARDLRKELEYNFKQYHEAAAKGDADASYYSSEIKKNRKQIMRQYSGTQSSMIPIVLEDYKTKLKRLEQTQNAVEGSNNKVAGFLPSGKSGELVFDDDGRITIRELPPGKSDETANSSETQNIGEEVALVVAKDFDKRNPNGENKFMRSLVLSTYAPMSVSTQITSMSMEQIEEEKQKLLEKRDILEEVFCEAKIAFISELSKIIEKLIGVKVFFDHATSKGGSQGELQNRVGVIISNCKISKLLADKTKDNFASVMKDSLGSNQPTERLWFAVVPNVVDGADISSNLSANADDPFADIDDDDEETAVNENEINVSINSLLPFLGIMEKARIMTIFDIRSEANTFAALSAQEVDDKMKLLESVNYSHAVYAYPNFTLMRPRPGFKPFQPYSDRVIELPGIYIDAAYPAAGLLVAIQQTRCLEDHGFRGRVDKDNVCVRVDLEDEDVKRNFKTKFNKESALQWNEDLKRAINSRMFGFAFCGDDVFDTSGDPWKNSYVYCARTLKRDNDRFKPIYKTMMEDYISILLSGQKPLNENKVENFFKDPVGKWVTQSTREKTQNNVNLILCKNENVTWKDPSSKKEIAIKFQSGTTTLDDIIVNSESTEEAGK